MNNKKSKPYAPEERGAFEIPPRTIRSYSEEDSVTLPDNVIDPIVSCNISNIEFDYTSPYFDDTLESEDEEF